MVKCRLKDMKRVILLIVLCHVYISVLAQDQDSTSQKISEIKALVQQASDAIKASKLDEVARLNDRSLELARTHLDSLHPLLGSIYYNHGLRCLYVSDYPHALQYYLKSLSIRKKHYGENDMRVAACYDDLGVTYGHMGKNELEMEYLEKALAIKLVLEPESEATAITYNNIGFAYHKTEDYEPMLDYFQKAAAILVEVYGDEHPTMAPIYNNLAFGYQLEKQYEKELDYYNKALQIYLKHYDLNHTAVPLTYNNIAYTYRNLGRRDKQLEYNLKALRQRIRMFGENHADVAISYNNLAHFYRETGQREAALEAFRKVLFIRRKIMGEVHPMLTHAYINIAEQHLEDEHVDSALHYIQRSMIANSRTFSTASVQENPSKDEIISVPYMLESLRYKGLLLKKRFEQTHTQSDMITSLACFALADSIIGMHRQGFSGADSRKLFSAGNKSLYEQALNAAFSFHKQIQAPYILEYAFRWMEKSHSLQLWESIIESEAKISAGLPSEVLMEERALRKSISEQEQEINRLIQEDETKDSPKVLQAQSRLFDTKQLWKHYIREMEDSFPKYFRLKYDSSIETITSIQHKQAQGEGTIMYFIGSDHIYLMGIQKETALFRQIPMDRKVGKTFQQLLNSLQDVDRVEREGNKPELIREFAEGSFTLYQYLLAPILEDPVFAEIEQLSFVPDGPLGYFPFEILLTSKVDSTLNFAGLPYLFNNYAVSYGYSATMLYRSALPTSSTSLFAGFAPSYSAEQASSFSLQKGFAPLVSNTKEVEDIVALLSGHAFIKDVATEASFKQYAPNYDIIHLAMHTEVNATHPMQSRFVFSLSSDTTEDGSLHAYEIYNLHLPAELAVLSACQTAQGHLNKGEGIMSLARAFTFAGCKNVVMSHWQANDASTRLLMQDFYTHMQAGQSKSEALRIAKKNFLEKSPYKHPYYWASFVLVGDAGPVRAFAPSFSIIWMLIPAAIIAVLIIYWYRRKRSIVHSL